MWKTRLALEPGTRGSNPSAAVPRVLEPGQVAWAPHSISTRLSGYRLRNGNGYRTFRPVWHKVSAQ